MEEWKQYRDTNYEVSNLGRVRNKTTKKIKKQGYKYKGLRKNDYLRVYLYLNRKDKIVSVHRMVAECFLSDYSDNLEVNHKNSKRNDNRAENLDMVTKEGNYQHSIKYGKGSQRKPVYTLDKEMKKHEFKSLWEAGRFIERTMKRGASIDHICTNIKSNLKGTSKSAYGYEWFWL